MGNTQKGDTPKQYYHEIGGMKKAFKNNGEKKGHKVREGIRLQDERRHLRETERNA